MQVAWVSVVVVESTLSSWSGGVFSVPGYANQLSFRREVLDGWTTDEGREGELVDGGSREP